MRFQSLPAQDSTSPSPSSIEPSDSNRETPVEARCLFEHSSNTLVGSDMQAASGATGSTRPLLQVLPELGAFAAVDASEKLEAGLGFASAAAVDAGAQAPQARFRTRSPKPWWVKWLPPGFLFFVGLVAQNFGLYIATYYYVIWMDRLNERVEVANSTEVLLKMALAHWESDLGDERHQNSTNSHMLKDAQMMARLKSNLDDEEAKENLSSSVKMGALHDALADWLNKRYVVPTTTLDVLSGIVPMFLLTFSVLTGNVRLWTKCCLCGALLAVLKGFLGAATVVPDSIGWEGCKSRLGPEGLKYFRDRKGLNFERQLFGSLGQLLWLELIGVENGDGSHHHLRFCADMMFSGHTYVCSVFSLGLYDIVRTRTAQLHPGCRLFLRLILGVSLTLLVLCDVVLILLNRFHYTMDVVVAVVLVLLLFSNPAIAIASENWAVWVSGEQSLIRACCSQYGERPRDDPEADERERGSVLVPPCCLPLCCFSGRYHLHERADLHEGFLADLRTLESSYERDVQDLQARLRDAEAELQSREHELQLQIQRAVSAKERYKSDAEEARKSTDEEKKKGKALETRVEDLITEYHTKEERLSEEKEKREAAERMLTEISKAVRKKSTIGHDEQLGVVRSCSMPPHLEVPGSAGSAQVSDTDI